MKLELGGWLDQIKVILQSTQLKYKLNLSWAWKLWEDNVFFWSNHEQNRGNLPQFFNQIEFIQNNHGSFLNQFGQFLVHIQTFILNVF